MARYSVLLCPGMLKDWRAEGLLCWSNCMLKYVYAEVLYAQVLSGAGALTAEVH